MKIVFFETEDWERDHLEETLSGHELAFHEGTLTAVTAEAAADADVASVFVYSRVDAETLAKMPNVRFVTTRSMGYDHIDLAACAERGVTVSRVPAYGERTVAEHTFALILALSRKIFQAYERTEKHVFDYKGLRGFDLYGKTIGIIGGGKIGLTVAKIAKGFEMEVLVSDPNERPDLAREIGFAYAPMDDLLARSHVITLHAPLVPATTHLIDQESIKKIRRGAVLVNTARGGLVDTKALLYALEQGILSGAGLDVLEEEQDLKEERELLSREYHQQESVLKLVWNHMLIARNDVIITPHIAFNSDEALRRIIETTAENIAAFAAGAPENVVT